MTVIQCVQLRQDTLIAQVTVPAAQPKIILYKVLLLKSCTPQISFFFFLNDTPPTEIYTLPLHDALPICYAETNHPTLESAPRMATIEHYSCLAAESKYASGLANASLGMFGMMDHAEHPERCIREARQIGRAHV